MIQQNIDSGEWAVAITGFRQWAGRWGAIGDGITRATASLVTRADTQAEADRIAAKIHAIQPRLEAGSREALEIVVLPYDAGDYLCRQDRQNGEQGFDRRRIAQVIGDRWVP